MGYFVFSGGERDVVFSAVGKGVLLAVGKMKFGFWQEGEESFWTSAIGFFQQEGERNVLVFCGREGWLLLAGGRRFAPPSFLSFGDVSFSRQGRVASFGRREWGLSGYPVSFPFRFSIPVSFPFPFLLLLPCMWLMFR